MKGNINLPKAMKSVQNVLLTVTLLVLELLAVSVLMDTTELTMRMSLLIVQVLKYSCDGIIVKRWNVLLSVIYST